MSGGIPMERMTPEEIARLKLRCTNRDGSAEVLTSKAWAHITLQDAEIEKLRKALDEAQREITQLYEDAAGESI